MKTVHGSSSPRKRPFIGLQLFPHKKGNPADSDVAAVAQCSSFLDVSEFSVFKLAHLEWYGVAIPERRMERIFHAYLEEERVPFWVRQFSRKVLALAEEGKLSSHLFDIPRPVVNEEDLAKGQWYIIVLTIVLITFCIFISGYPSV